MATSNNLMRGFRSGCLACSYKHPTGSGRRRLRRRGRRRSDTVEPEEPALCRLLADLEIAHQFEGANQGGMVPGTAALGDTGVEQLLAGRGVGQRQLERPGA